MRGVLLLPQIAKRAIARPITILSPKAREAKLSRRESHLSHPSHHAIDNSGLGDPKFRSHASDEL